MFDSVSYVQLGLLGFILIMNVYTFILFYTDKQKAIKRQRRISERKLLVSSFALGGLGAWLSMGMFRHKTKHLTFKIGVPLAALLTLAAILSILFYNR